MRIQSGHRPPEESCIRSWCSPTSSAECGVDLDIPAGSSSIRHRICRRGLESRSRENGGSSKLYAAGVQSASEAGDQLWNDAIASSPRNRNVFKAVEKVRSLAKDLLYLERTIRDRLNFLLGSAPYFRKLNELYRPVASAKSDADGQFSISVPDAGEFAIVAYAERQTFDKTEKYFWVVPVAEKIDLSNDNQTSATSGAGLLHVVGNDDLADATVTGDAIQAKFDEIKNKHADIFPAVAASAPK